MNDFFAGANEVQPTEGDIVLNSYTDTLYSHDFKNGQGKYFNIITMDESGIPGELELELSARLRISIVFIKEKNDISGVELKKYKYHKTRGWIEEKTESIKLSYLTFQKLIGFLKFLSSLDLKGINERRVALSDGLNQDLDEETIKKVKTILAKKDGIKIIEELLNSGIITSSDIVNIGYRKKQLEVFGKLLNEEGYINNYRQENNINDSRIEPVWQHFFAHNDWIFGYGLDYKFLGILQKEAHLSSSDLAGKEEIIGDFLLGCNKFTVLVELKKPSTCLFDKDKNRSNCWSLSTDFINSVSQILEQKASWQVSAEKNATQNFDDSGELLHQKTFDPKAILVIGRSSEFSGEEKEQIIKSKTFELFRRDSRNINIMTFDELFERAKFIVYHKENKI